MRLAPGKRNHKGSVPIHEKKYFAEIDKVAVVPEKMEFDFFTKEGKSVFLSSSTTMGTRKIEVMISAVIKESGKMTARIKKNLVKKTKGS